MKPWEKTSLVALVVFAILVFLSHHGLTVWSRGAIDGDKNAVEGALKRLTLLN